MGVLRGDGEGDGDRLRGWVFLADVGTPSRPGAGEDSRELGPAMLMLESVPLPTPTLETFNKLPFLFFESFSFFLSLPLSLILSFSTVGDSRTSFLASSDMSSC